MKTNRSPISSERRRSRWNGATSRDYVEQRIGNVMDPDLYFRLRDHIYADFNYMRTNDLRALEFSGRYPDNPSKRSTTTPSWQASWPARLDFDIIHSHDWLTYPAGIHAKAGDRKAAGDPCPRHRV